MVPEIGAEEIEAVAEVLRSGFLVQGERVVELERAVAAYVGSREAVAVSSCTAALHVSLLTLGIGSGDRVAVPSYSWPATANVVVACGAEPVFLDIEPLGLGLDPDRLHELLSGDAPVACVLPVHAFGGPADLEAIVPLAKTRDIPLVEDAACALGTEISGRRVGAWGRLGCFSFHPRKAITTGEGGMIVTDDPRLARQARMLRNHGLDPEAAQADFVLPGFNLRMTEFQAALGLAQLHRLDAILDVRERLARRYDELLQGSGVETPRVRPGGRHVYQSYVVLVPRERAGRRDELIAAMRTRGVEVTIGTHHIPLTRYYRERWGYRPGDFPVTDDVASRALTLPLHGRLAPADQEHVVAALRGCL